jgi:hypothetical protein
MLHLMGSFKPRSYFMSSVSPTHQPAPANVADTEIAMKLASLQRTYGSALTHGESPSALASSALASSALASSTLASSTLASMAKRIASTAQELGLNVALPQETGVRVDLQA